MLLDAFKYFLWESKKNVAYECHYCSSHLLQYKMRSVILLSFGTFQKCPLFYCKKKKAAGVSLQHIVADRILIKTTIQTMSLHWWDDQNKTTVELERQNTQPTQEQQ